MSVNKPIQLGLCCLNIELRDSKPTVFCSRRMIIKSIEQKGLAVLNAMILVISTVVQGYIWRKTVRTKGLPA